MESQYKKNTDIERNEGYWYKYPRPAVTADSVVFGFDGEELKVLLIQRGCPPYEGMWALPGGFMKMDETIEECASRELSEETNVRNVYLEQFKVYSSVDRDPRGRVITVAFIAMVNPSQYSVAGGDDAKIAAWFEVGMLPPLAFDHQEIITQAKERLREILKVRPLAFKLLEEKFTVDELRKVYESVNETNYDRRNFQRKLIQSDIVESTDAETDSMDEKINNSNSLKVKRQGRKPSRLFRLRNIFDDSNSKDDNESSLKDLFNF